MRLFNDKIKIGDNYFTTSFSNQNIMKHLLLLLLCLFVCKAFCSDSKYNFKAGVGYFADIYYYLHNIKPENRIISFNPEINKPHHGQSVFLEFGRTFKTRHTIALKYDLGLAGHVYEDPLKFYFIKTCF